MVDEKMTQCADSIDTQFNVLFETWKKHVHDWFKTDTCSKEGCVCKEAGFCDIKSQKDLWAFLFRGECAPKPDPTRRLPHDVGEHTQLAHPCVVAECDEKGCLKDKLERWKSCPVQNKKGSETEVKSKKWTPVPRGKAKAVADDDGDGDYDPDADKAEKWSKEMLPFECSRPDFMSLHLDSMQEYVEHREDCWWDWRNRKLQDVALINTAGTSKAGTRANARTDFSARESYEQQDSATGQKPNVGSVCVSIVQHSPSTRQVSTYTKEVISEDDAKGFARKVVTYAKGEHVTEEKVVLRTDVHFGYARNKGNARFHHTFHQDIISMYKTGKVRHAFASWHEGKVLPGCKNYANEEGEKWAEADFPALLPYLVEMDIFTDGAIPQYQCRDTTHGTACSFADLGVRITHDVHTKYDFKGPWDAYGKESTESRRSAVRNRTATINNAYLHAKHNSQAMARPKQEKSEARWRDYAADHYFHHYYRYGEDEKGMPTERDDLIGLAAEPVKDLMSYKHYEGGITVRGVGDVEGFAFMRSRRGCYCVPLPGESCSHGQWTGELDRGKVKPVSAARAGGAAVPPHAATRRGGPSVAYRESIDDGFLLCMPGDEDDETADGEDIWYANALGQAEKNTVTFDCGPCRLYKKHYSVPVEWLKLVELTDEYAIFNVWPTEQNRIAVAHLMNMPDLEWVKVEGEKYFMSRAQYDMSNDQL